MKEQLKIQLYNTKVHKIMKKINFTLRQSIFCDKILIIIDNVNTSPPMNASLNNFTCINMNTLKKKENPMVKIKRTKSFRTKILSTN